MCTEERPRGLFAPPYPLSVSQRKVEGTWLHPEMRPCVSNLGTGKRGLCLEQPEPEAEGIGGGSGGCMMLIALYLSLGRRAAANSSSQVCKLSLLASREAMKSN